MAEIKLSAREQKNFQLDMGERASHKQLKNLSFEESGHRGFQKELTQEQLELIEKVKNKEDVINRVTVISDESTHEQYPSAKAVYDAVDECGKMELIDSAEITEDVVQIAATINGQYKEIYWVFEIPPMSTIDSADKGRVHLFYISNPGTYSTSKLIQQGNVIIPNYEVGWRLMMHSELFGNYARTEIWYREKGVMIDGSYGLTVGSENGIVAPFTLLPNPYIDDLTVRMVSAKGGRVFPEGTKFELWGVRK